MFKFNDMSIGRKLTLGFGTLVAIVVLFGFYSFWIMGRINMTATEIGKHYLPDSIALGQIDARTADFRTKEYTHANENKISVKKGLKMR